MDISTISPWIITTILFILMPIIWLILFYYYVFPWFTTPEWEKIQRKVKKFEEWDYNVEILNINSQKLIYSIKSIKEVLDLWLKRANDLLTNLPAIAISWISEFDAEKIKEKLEKIGMEVKITKKNNI